MAETPRRCPGLDLFWEDADLTDSAEHPLRRELAHRIDVLARYERLIVDAQTNGHDDLLTNLTAQHRRQLNVIEALQAALTVHDARDVADIRQRNPAHEPAERPLSGSRHAE